LVYLTFRQRFLLIFQLIEEPAGVKDWNDQLRATPSLSFPTAWMPADENSLAL